MTLEEELGCLKAAYGNCVNDLARTREHLKQAEDTLRLLASVMEAKANIIQNQHEDNPGRTGSGS